MIFGFSKSLGKGFRIGFYKRLFSRKPKKGGPKRARSDEFGNFVKKVEYDLNYYTKVFLIGNGYNYQQLYKQNGSLDDIASDAPYFDEFMQLRGQIVTDIEKALYAGTTGKTEKKHITNQLFKLRDLMQQHYGQAMQRVGPDRPGKANKSLLRRIAFIAACVLIFLMFYNGASSS